MFSRPYAKLYDLFNEDKPYKKEIQFVHRWAGKPRSIFDIGCGTGSYWKHYPKGTHVVGIERSKDMAEQGERIVFADAMTFKTGAKFECATSLFHAINYIPRHDWWKNIPVKKGGYFIFDIWDSQKVDNDGYQKTFKQIGKVWRRITPVDWNSHYVDLNIEFWDGEKLHEEKHRMYLYSNEDIKKFSKGIFKIVEVKETERWPIWYKLRRI